MGKVLRGHGRHATERSAAAGAGRGCSASAVVSAWSDVIMTSSCFALQSAAAANCASRRAVVACLLLRLVFFFLNPFFRRRECTPQNSSSAATCSCLVISCGLLCTLFASRRFSAYYRSSSKRPPFPLESSIFKQTAVRINGPFRLLYSSHVNAAVPTLERSVERPAEH